MTLAELLVSIGLLAMIGTLVTATAILTMRTMTTSQVRIDDAIQGELGLAAASKVLRTAVLPELLDNQTCAGCSTTAITDASGTRIRFYANLDNNGVGPSQVTLCVTRTPRYGCDTAPSGAARDPRPSLVQDTLPPIRQGGADSSTYTFCTSSCTPQRRILSRELTIPVSTTDRRVSSAAATTLPKVFTFYDYNGLSLGSGTMQADDLKRISSIDVILTVQTGSSDPAHPTRTALTRVRLPNVEINVVTLS